MAAQTLLLRVMYASIPSDAPSRFCLNQLKCFYKIITGKLQDLSDMSSTHLFRPLLSADWVWNRVHLELHPHVCTRYTLVCLNELALNSWISDHDRHEFDHRTFIFTRNVFIFLLFFFLWKRITLAISFAQFTFQSIFASMKLSQNAQNKCIVSVGSVECNLWHPKATKLVIRSYLVDISSLECSVTSFLIVPSSLEISDRKTLEWHSKPFVGLYDVSHILSVELIVGPQTHIHHIVLSVTSLRLACLQCLLCLVYITW